MIKILFVCHGNICRSPMAEYMMKDMVKYRQIDALFRIDSAAATTEEIGHDIHSGAKAKMDAVGIPYEKRHARQVTLSDYEYYDYIIAMDDENVRDMERIFGPDTAHKIHKLLEFAGQSRNVADPWYTGDFDTTYDDLLLGISSLLKSLNEERKAG